MIIELPEPDATDALPSHVEEAIQAMAAMHAAHHQQSSTTERFIDRVTATVAKSTFLIYVAGLLLAWITGSSLLERSGVSVPDVWPFPFLALVISCTALFISVLILASQRRADRLANLRSQMTLETVLLITQKASKLIDLIEEFRRDSPDVKDRIDLEAVEMAGMPDHDAVISAIQVINENKPAAEAENQD
jgi:uncharacterized membrane protein